MSIFFWCIYSVVIGCTIGTVLINILVIRAIFQKPAMCILLLLSVPFLIMMGALAKNMTLLWLGQ